MLSISYPDEPCVPASLPKAKDGSYFIVARVAAAQPGTETKEAQSLTLLIHDLHE